MRARARLPYLVFHPPATKRTLFDSQLQLAGYSAQEFRDAGFDARELSYDNFMYPLYNEEELTPQEKEWLLTCAFFTATQMREANYTEWELQCARFSNEDLREAGFVPDKQKCDVSPTAMSPQTVKVKDKKHQCYKGQPIFGEVGGKAVSCRHSKTPGLMDGRNKRRVCARARSSNGKVGHKAVCVK